MSDFTCPVVEIKLHNHPNAENLSLIYIGGYQVIVRTEEWQDKKLGVFIPPDSVVPCTKRFEFLRGHNHIRVRKFRGFYSQGLLIPAPHGARIGEDYANHFGITHYQPPEKFVHGNNVRGPSNIIVPKYDVESLKNSKFLRMIEEGETVYISEKIHGCLKYNTRISLPNGSRKRICEIIEDGSIKEVMGFDHQTQSIKPVKIINRFINGKTREWLKIKYTLSKAGRGHWYGAIICTKNHKIFNIQTNAYVEAIQLRKGDKVKLIRSEVEQKIMSIETITTPYEEYRYDLETETHNYFANGLLVHNCNSRFLFWDNEFWLGSRTNWKKRDERNPWSIAIDNHPEVERFCRENPGLVVYGECYGQVQNLRYGLNTVKFVVFDMWDGIKWLQYNDAKAMSQKLPWVPELYVGSFDIKMAEELAEKNSDVPGANHLREGVVIRPIPNKFDNRYRRIQLKLVSNKYLSL